LNASEQSEPDSEAAVDADVAPPGPKRLLPAWSMPRLRRPLADRRPPRGFAARAAGVLAGILLLYYVVTLAQVWTASRASYTGPIDGVGAVDRAAIVLAGILFKRAVRDIHQPNFWNASGGIAGQLFPPVVDKRCTGYLDDQ
jgi:hypothetical protein